MYITCVGCGSSPGVVGTSSRSRSSRSHEMPAYSGTACAISSSTCAGPSQEKPCAPIALATAQSTSRSLRESVRLFFVTLRRGCTRRSTFVYVPVFSAHTSAGKTTFARSVIADGNTLVATRKSSASRPPSTSPSVPSS